MNEHKNKKKILACFPMYEVFPIKVTIKKIYILETMQLYSNQQIQQLADKIKAEFTDEWIDGHYAHYNTAEAMRDEILKLIEKK